MSLLLRALSHQTLHGRRPVASAALNWMPTDLPLFSLFVPTLVFPFVQNGCITSIAPTEWEQCGKAGKLTEK